MPSSILNHSLTPMELSQRCFACSEMLHLAGALSEVLDDEDRVMLSFECSGIELTATFWIYTVYSGEIYSVFVTRA